MALSPKQKKIAKMAGDPNKIEGEDFKKLKTMKAGQGEGVELAKKHKEYVKDKAGTVAGYASEMIKPLMSLISPAGKAARAVGDRLTKSDIQSAKDPIGIDKLPESMRSSESLNSKKDKDRVTRADIESSMEPFMKNTGGVMKASSGKMIMARGCKMGRNKPTKLS